MNNPSGGPVGPAPLPPSPVGPTAGGSKSPFSPGKNVLFTLNFSIPAILQPQPCPELAIPDGATVQLLAKTGNVGSTWAATYRGAFSSVDKFGNVLNALLLSDSFFTLFSVANLSQIWISGKSEGDTVLVLVTKGV